MDREPNPLLDFFPSELRRARSAAGLCQEALGKRIGFSGEMVGKIENGDRRPSDKFAEGCDLVFSDLGGVFTRLLEKAVRSRGVYPAWFASWVDAEHRASVLCSWEPLMMPGLLQTAEYARAIFEADRPRITLQVVPAEVGVHVGLLGGFATASFADDTPGQGVRRAALPARVPQRAGHPAVLAARGVHPPREPRPSPP